MKFKDLYKTLNFMKIELFFKESKSDKPFYAGDPNRIPLSLYLDIEDKEVRNLSGYAEKGICNFVLIIVLNGSW